MYCTKCGTEQHEGQKFCPKCGEPFLDEKVKSQLNETIEEYKKADRKEKQTESINIFQGFFSDTAKLRAATIIIALVAVLWFFIFNHGFSASWSWWFLAIVFIVASFYKVEFKSKDDALKKTRWSLLFALLLGFVFITHSFNSNSKLVGMDDNGINIKANNAQEEDILMKMSRVYGEINSTLPNVEALYNVHRQYVSQGGNPNFSPAWGKWQDYNDKIDKLWDEYISLAHQLDDNEDIIREAKEKKRTMDKAFTDMFAPHY